MSDFSTMWDQFTGKSAADAQSSAIQQQQQYWKQYQDKNQAGWDTAMKGYQAAIDPMKGVAQAEYQGALKDIYDQGRTQASQSGLIGGFQEGQNTAPAIAALGRSFGTQMAQLQLSPYQMQMQQYGQNQQMGAQQYGQSLGNYSQGANPLGSIFGAAGAIGGAAAGFGSLFGGGRNQSQQYSTDYSIPMKSYDYN